MSDSRKEGRCSDCEHLQLQAKRQVVGWARESVLATRNEVPELDEKLSQLMQPSDGEEEILRSLSGPHVLALFRRQAFSAHRCSPGTPAPFHGRTSAHA
eukprot:768518-Hanusia_phi.AAC.6